MALYWISTCAPGEKPGAMGVLDLGDTDNMTVEAEVYQTLIGRVSIGDSVKIFSEALEQDLTGSVTAIGIQIGRQTITSDDPCRKHRCPGCGCDCGA